MSKHQNDLENGIPPQLVDDAVRRIVHSDPFAKSERLTNFLIYIVGKTLEGRSKEIRGKTIAQDVYGRTPQGESDNVVRVDARRLRRRLVEYYATDGRDDPLRIVINTGGYVPRFEWNKPQLEGKDPKKQSRAPSRVWSYAAVGVLGGVVVGALITAAIMLNSASVGSIGEDPQAPQREALLHKSAATLQAANLIDEARGMLFPIADAKRQKLATTIFRDAIRIDRTYAGGYAGAAHSLSTRAILSPNGAGRDTLLSDAKQMAEQAIELAPTNAWSQSAAAWVAFAHQDYQRAYDLSARAEKLDPIDGGVLDFRGVITLLTGHFEEAVNVANPSRQRRAANTKFAYRNIFGAANFHIGKYQAAIRSFREAARLGDPVSELSLMYRAAANQGAGNTEAARSLVREMVDTWPRFRPDLAARKFYQHKKHADELLTKLRAAGWRKP